MSYFPPCSFVFFPVPAHPSKRLLPGSHQSWLLPHVHMWVQNHKVEEKKSKLLGVNSFDLGNNSKTPVYEQYMNNV